MREVPAGARGVGARGGRNAAGIAVPPRERRSAESRQPRPAPPRAARSRPSRLSAAAAGSRPAGLTGSAARQRGAVTRGRPA